MNLSDTSLQTASVLSTPRWPSYKPHGPAFIPALEACPTNLHTSTIDVVTTGTPTPSTTPTHDPHDKAEGEFEAMV